MNLADSINRLFDVDTVFSTNTLRITCSFLSPTPAKYKRSCTVLLGSKQEPSCDQLTQPLKNEYTVRANRSLVSVDLPIFPTENVSQTMCFVVIASDGVLIAEAKGMLMVIAGILYYYVTVKSKQPHGMQSFLLNYKYQAVMQINLVISMKQNCLVSIVVYLCSLLA